MFLSDRHLGPSLSIPEDKNIGSFSSVTGVPLRDDGKPAGGVKNQHADKQPGKTVLTPVRQGGGSRLTTKLVAAEASVAEAGGNSAPATQAVSAVLPTNLPVPSQEDLPAVGSYENLKSLLEAASSSENYGGGIVFLPGLPQVIAFASVQRSATADAPNAQDYSKTNVQVEGVDEADIVKTDGTYIYQVNRERIVITKAFPPENMEIACTLNYEGKGFTPQEIYVDEDHLVVIGSASRSWDYPVNKGRVGIMPMPMLMPAYCWPREMVKALVYDIRDRSNIRQVRELELNGNYVSSRKVDKALYLIANKSLYFRRGMKI
ncbi:MAG: beta-propeller domain-containing protein, partial [Victivallales bacterium]